MRIAYVCETYPPDLNGIALSAQHTVQHLRHCGHQVDLVCENASGPVHSDPGGRKGRYRTVPLHPELHLRWASPAMLRARFSLSGSELVHLATPGPLAWAAAYAARRAGLALTSDFTSNFHKRGGSLGLNLWPLFQLGLRRFHNNTLCTFVPTKSLRKELEQAGFERLTVVDRGVDTQRFTPTLRSRELRTEWSAAPGQVLLYVGRLTVEKNVTLALQAFRAIRQHTPSVRMVVIGDGPLRRSLELAYPEAMFVGVLQGESLARHYASADILLFPSMTDIVANVLLEAMASGLAVVAFDTPAAQHLVGGESGLLASPGQTNSFLHASECMVAAGTASEPIRQRARDIAMTLGWERVLSNFEQQLTITVETHHMRSPGIGCAMT